MRKSVVRQRWRWTAAWLAVLLNLAAPVLGYGNVDAVHEAARASHAGPDHHAADHPVAGDGTESSPAAPHCPYCLDFAAGAPLGSTTRLDVPPVVPIGAPAERSVADLRSIHTPGLALARGPPRELG
jgi:hypothetical protein